MREIRTSGLMSGAGKRGGALRQCSRPASTLPSQLAPALAGSLAKSSFEKHVFSMSFIMCRSQAGASSGGLVPSFLHSNCQRSVGRKLSSAGQDEPAERHAVADNFSAALIQIRRTETRTTAAIFSSLSRSVCGCAFSSSVPFSPSRFSPCSRQ